MVYLQNSSARKDNIIPLRKEDDKTTNVKKNDKGGHRARVKEKFKMQDISVLSNTDIIEALLFFCNSRRDVRPEAKELLRLSKDSILKFLFLTAEDLKMKDIKYVGESLLLLNKIILELAARFFKEKIEEYTFENIEDVKNYLIVRSSFLAKEEMRVLFLNAKNRLIDDKVTSKGTVNETPIYVREIVSLALQKSAVSIIISHNHPSRDTTPSMEDIQMTYNLKQALESVSIVLQDHIIVGGISSYSFKQEKLI